MELDYYTDIPLEGLLLAKNLAGELTKQKFRLKDIRKLEKNFQNS